MIDKPSQGRQLQRWERKPIILNIFFPANCMKLKKKGPRGGTYLAPPLDPPRRCSEVSEYTSRLLCPRPLWTSELHTDFPRKLRSYGHFSKFTAQFKRGIVSQRVLPSGKIVSSLSNCSNMSWFAEVEAAAPIEVFALTQSFNDDPHPQKVNLSVGGKC